MSIKQSEIFKRAELSNWRLHDSANRRQDKQRSRKYNLPTGIYNWNIGHNKYRVSLKECGKLNTIGYFRTIEEATMVNSMIRNGDGL